MTLSHFLTLREGHSLQQLIEVSSPGISEALKKLNDSGESVDHLERLVRAREGDDAVNILRSILQNLTREGALLRSVYTDSQLLARQIPLSKPFIFEEKTIEPEQRYLLSRFAYLHKEQDMLVLESPLSHSRIQLHNWLATAILDQLTKPVSVRDLCGTLPDLPEQAALMFLSLLLSAQMISETTEAGVCLEDERINLQSWEFHDLLFHSRSRGGRHDHPAGGTYRFKDRFDPPPLFKEWNKDSPTFSLFRPDLERLQQTDPPYARVQEGRSSIREYSQTPISDRELGEFLYRVGRVADYLSYEIPSPGAGMRKIEFASRPYPAAGGVYELELYVIVNRCRNVSPGLHYYDPEAHRLVTISGITPLIEQLLRDAGQASMIPVEQIQLLIIIAARFQKIAWKYSTLAYAAMLKNVGVLYQTMYLAATAMDLAPCAIGYGNSDIFADAAGTDYYFETSIGEFLLGRKSGPQR